MMRALARLDAIVGATLRVIPIACLAALFLLLLVNVLARYFQLGSLAWFDEVVQGLFAWMVFIGTAALWREGEHFRVDWLEQRLPAGSARAAMRILIALLSLTFLIVMTWKGLDLTRRSAAVTPILNLPVAVLYAAIPIAGALMCVYTLVDLWRAVRSFATNPERTTR